jgi:hypothetical protein
MMQVAGTPLSPCAVMPLRLGPLHLWAVLPLSRLSYVVRRSLCLMPHSSFSAMTLTIKEAP